MHRRQGPLVSLFCLVTPVLAITSAQALGADYQVHVVTPAVTNHMIPRDGPLPPVCREAATMEVFACRGEYEPTSFVVTAAKELKGVRSVTWSVGLPKRR